jgi:hypothetical protein
MLGYKIPVVWAEEDWFGEDRSRPEDPALLERRERKNGRRGRGRGREREPRRPAPDAAPTRPKLKRVPGAFFGFGPEPEEPIAEEPVADAVASEIETPPEVPVDSSDVMTEEIEKVEKPKKRRRRRRKKRIPSADSGVAPSAAAAPGTGDPMEPSGADDTRS